MVVSSKHAPLKKVVPSGTIMKSALRLLTVLCYFLPFTFFVVTCNGLELNTAYNKREAKKNKEAAMRSEKMDTTMVDTFRIPAAQSTDTSGSAAFASTVSDSLQQESAPKTAGEFWQGVLLKVIAPTKTSLSAVGTIFYYKNLTGQILIAISLLLSILLALRIPRNKAFTHYVLWADLFCLIAFMADSFVSGVGVRWGAWILLTLLLLQAAMYLRERRTASAEQ